MGGAATLDPSQPLFYTMSNISHPLTPAPPPPAVATLGTAPVVPASATGLATQIMVTAPGSLPVLPTPMAALMASQLNGKQHARRASKAQQTAIDLRNLHWPDIKDEDLWLLGDRKRGGFAQVPRTLSIIMNVINDITKRDSGKAVPAGKTYLVLWLRVFDEGFVRIDSESEVAYEAGYHGERNVATFHNHMQILKKLGFIDFRRGTKGPMQYVLMLNPYKVVKQLHTDKLIPTEQYAALIERAGAIGAAQELKD